MPGSMPSSEWSQNCASSSFSHNYDHIVYQNLCTLYYRLESSLVLKGGIAHALAITFKFNIATTLMLFLSFVGFVATGGELTPRKVFTTLSLIEFLRRTSMSYMSRSLFFVYEVKVALVRIQVRNTETIMIILMLYKVILYLQKLLELENVQSLTNENSDVNGISFANESKHTKFAYGGVTNGSYFRPPSSPELLRLSSEQVRKLERSRSTSPSFPRSHCLVKMENVSALWPGDEERLVLEGINFELTIVSLDIIFKTDD